VAVVAGLIQVVTCVCKEFYSKLADSTTHCARITAPPTPRAVDQLYTPAPTAHPEPTELRHGCDETTTKKTFTNFCTGPDRRLALWLFPGSTEMFCEQMSVVENITSLGLCERYCGEALGGPPVCDVIKYDKDTQVRVVLWIQV
jgi:hypothetical protein